MADNQLPVDYSQLNDAYQDNTSKAITARHGRQLLANASPFFFSLEGKCQPITLLTGNGVDITKLWLDNNGNNNIWLMNGFLVSQSENEFLIENVSGANLLAVVSMSGYMGPFTNGDHSFEFRADQQVSGQPMESFAGHSVTNTSYNDTAAKKYGYVVSDTVTRRIKAGAKIKLQLNHLAGGADEDFDFVFRFVIQAMGSWRGYSGRFPGDTNNSDRGQDIGGIKYE